MVTRSLPQNFIKNSGILIDAVNSVDNHTATGCTIETNEDIFGRGHGTITATASDTTSNQIKISKTVNINLLKYDVFGLEVYCDDIPTITQIQFKMYNATKGIASSKIPISGDNLNGKMYLTWTKEDLDLETGASFDGIVKIDLIATRIAGSMPSITFGEFRVGLRFVPKLILSFDDGLVDVYTKQFPKMQVNGLKGTAYIVKNLIKTTGYMTEAHLKELYDAGWALGNHTDNHADLTNYTTAEDVESHITTNKEYLDSLGYTKASEHLAYPHGATNDLVLETVKGLIKTGRNVTLLPYQVPILGDRNVLINGTDCTSLNDAKTFIDHTIQYGGTCIFLFHQLDASGYWTTAEFNELIDYVASKKGSIQCLTIDEFYEGLTNPRYSSIPVERTQVNRAIANRS